MTFAKRKINLTFRLGKSTQGVQYTFTEGGYDTVTVTGNRVQASITNAGGASMGQALVRVYGLTPSLLNQLSNVTRVSSGQITMRFNQLVIEAGDDISGMSIIFQGQIGLSQIDMSQPPDSALSVVAHAGLFEAVKLAAASSYRGSADAAVIMQNLAAQNDYVFENNGVSVMLSTPYFSGSPRQQMEQCAQAANINWVIDNGTLAIWPMGASRGGVIPLVSPKTGMIGYPTNFHQGVSVRTLFNPQLQVGRAVQVQSSLPFANGKFAMFDLSHELESETPNGRWETAFHGSPYNVPS